MTQRLQDALNRASARGGRALVTYLTAGDPHLDATPALMHALANNGADIIELGVPFSDPIADGPVIQRASQRALKAGTRLSGILDAVRAFRAADPDTPIILFGYLNPLLAYGLERLADAIAEAGADGVLVVDLPVEEAGALRGALAERGLVTVFLVSPNTSDARLPKIAEAASGFVYYVSLTGVTGSQLSDFGGVEAGVARVKAHTDLPVCVGFGVATPDDAARVGAAADGVVVGSAIVRRVEEGGAVDAIAARVGAFVAGLKAPLRGAEIAD